MPHSSCAWRRAARARVCKCSPRRHSPFPTGTWRRAALARGRAMTLLVGTRHARIYGATCPASTTPTVPRPAPSTAPTARARRAACSCATRHAALTATERTRMAPLITSLITSHNYRHNYRPHGNGTYENCTSVCARRALHACAHYGASLSPQVRELHERVRPHRHHHGRRYERRYGRRYRRPLLPNCRL